MQNMEHGLNYVKNMYAAQKWEKRSSWSN